MSPAPRTSSAALHRRDGPLGDLRAALAVAAGDHVLAEPPGPVARRVHRLDLPAEVALPGPAVGLAEVGVAQHFQPGPPGKRGGCLGGADEVGGQDRGGRQPGEQARGTLGLLQAGRVELDVEVALEAVLGVPRGPAVAPQDDVPALAARAARPGHAPGRWTAAPPDVRPSRPMETDSGSGTTGQSRQSRSRA